MSNYPYFGVPPSREHRPAAEEPALTGKRVILSTSEGLVFDMGAASELRTDGQGNLVIDILTETQYFRERLTDRRFEPSVWPAHLVWID